MDGNPTLRRAVWTITLCAAALVALGWCAIGRSEQLLAGNGRLLRQQIVWSLLSLGAMTAASAIDYRRVARLSNWIFGATIVALVAVYLFPAVNGAHRWIRIGGIGLQPSEFAKLAFIAALARYLVHADVTAGFTSMLWPLAMATLPMMLVLREPDLGTSLVFLPVLAAMLFVAGARRQDLARLAMVGVLLMPLLWSQMSHEQRSRITALWEQNLPRESATGDGFHLDQAKRMFALGGMWGSFIAPAAEDDLPTCRVPEPHTDSVYCVLGERLGMCGAAAVLVLFGLLVASCLSIAQYADGFARLFPVGVAALFATEALINTGMFVGLLPITGLSLPLISYGGSGLMAHALALGVVISVARHDV